MVRAGHILLAIGFLGGAFAAVQHPTHINWVFYGAFVAAALVGLVLVRVGQHKAKSVDTKVLAEVDAVERGINSLVDKLKQMEDKRESVDVFAVHGAIDAELRSDFDDVVDARMSLATRYGLQSYADLMTKFAGAERQVNRAWSASADGYIDEVYKSLASASRQMARAQELMRSYRARDK